jgi:hypothetical protein
VFHPAFGDLPDRLRAALERELHLPVRIYNLAYPGRTTLDSYDKYRHLADKQFDLVVVYEGLNDCFLNNCPARVFRSDYTHAPRYEQILTLDRHPEHPFFALPYSALYLASRLEDQWKLSTQPGPRWFRYASELKTPASFEANLERIIRTAAIRGDGLLLMTYALYVPANYSEEAFKAKALDYARHTSPLSVWGTVESVPAAVDAHNAVARLLAARYPDVAFVDQQRLMPVGKLYYDDPCHLTPRGCDTFVCNLVRAVNWGAWFAARRSAALAGAHSVGM